MFAKLHIPRQAMKAAQTFLTRGFGFFTSMYNARHKYAIKLKRCIDEKRFIF
jgi:hypothetical protein